MLQDLRGGLGVAQQRAQQRALHHQLCLIFLAGQAPRKAALQRAALDTQCSVSLGFRIWWVACFFGIGRIRMHTVSSRCACMQSPADAWQPQMQTDELV